MNLSHYAMLYPYEKEPAYVLLYSTLTTSTVLVEKELIEKIGTSRLSHQEMEHLGDLGLMVMNTEDEKKKVLEILDTMNGNNKRIDMVVVLNLNCNLSCVYCFEGDMKGKLYMGQRTADSLIDFVSQNLSPDKEILNVDYYGGEPLLSLDLLKYVSSRLKRLISERNVVYKFSLVTNGTLLTEKVIEKLVPLGLNRAKVTLDGPKSNHDMHRPFKSGGGSFDAILSNIKKASEMIEIYVGGNFSEKNYETFPELLDLLLSKGLTPGKIPNVKFDPLVKPDNWQAPQDFRDGCESINEPWLFDASLYLRGEILKRGYNTPEIVPAPCAIDIRDYYVVNYDGSIYKCPGLIGKERFKIGSVENGIQDYRSSHNLGLWKDEKDCIECEYLPLCFGGCRYMKFMRDGNIDGVDCRREYLDATLETFIKQDVEYRYTS